MCIAVYKPEGIKLDEDIVRRCWNNNPHGGGFAYRDEAGKIEVVRGFMKLRKFMRAWNKIDNEAYDMILHFRWATHGTTTPDNTHPFPLTGGALAHNGVLSCMPNEKLRSDTRVFAEDFIEPMMKYHPAFGTLPYEKKWLEDVIGHSKVLLMTEQDTIIANEKLGVWDLGCWFSNDDYKFDTYRQEYMYGTCQGYQEYAYAGMGGGRTTDLRTLPTGSRGRIMTYDYKSGSLKERYVGEVEPRETVVKGLLPEPRPLDPSVDMDYYGDEDYVRRWNEHFGD